MEVIYSREMRVPSSRCGPDGKLSVPAAFELVMDMATEHAEELGMGLAALRKRGLIWVAVRARIRFFRWPGMLERVTITTWPEKPGAIRCCRDVTLSAGEEILAAARTEYAVLDLASLRPCPMGDVYPPELTEKLGEEKVFSEPFARIREKFAPEERLGEYTVRPTDIDMAGHMNNTMYPRMVLDLIPVEEQRRRPLGEMELCYRTPCYEGDTLTLYRRETPEGAELAAFLPEGKPALLVKMTY